MSIGASGSSSGSSSSSTPVSMPGDLMGTRNQLNAYFRNQLNNGGTAFGNTPDGPLKSAYTNLFGGGTDDFLGAKQAVQNGLSGQSFGNAFNSFMSAAMPSAMNAYNVGAQQLANQAGANGMRFSTDLLGAQNRLMQNSLANLQSTAALNAATYAGQQNSLASSIYSLIGGLGQNQISMSQLPALLKYAETFAPVGQSSNSNSSSSSYGFNVGIG